MIEVYIEPVPEIYVEVLSELVPVGDYEHYKGDYSVTPKAQGQTLETKNKVMDFNVTVREIPYKETPNSGGRGMTVRIG